MMMRIEELTTEADFREAFPVFKELRPYVDEARFFERLKVMLPRGYRLFTLRDGIDNCVVAVAGVELTETMRGRQLHVHELITTETVRSKGYGAAMMHYLEQYARSQECDILELSSNVTREDAHRFYESKIGMMRTSYLFRKQLR